MEDAKTPAALARLSAAADLELALKSLATREGRFISFAEAREMTRSGERWLRSLLERKGNTDLGEKDGSGRWRFNPNDIFYIATMNSLSFGASMPPAAAKAVADEIAPMLGAIEGEDQIPRTFNICMLGNAMDGRASPIVWDPDRHSGHAKAIQKADELGVSIIAFPAQSIVAHVTKGLIRWELKKLREEGQLSSVAAERPK